MRLDVDVRQTQLPHKARLLFTSTGALTQYSFSCLLPADGDRYVPRGEFERLTAEMAAREAASAAREAASAARITVLEKQQLRDLAARLLPPVAPASRSSPSRSSELSPTVKSSQQIELKNKAWAYYGISPPTNGKHPTMLGDVDYIKDVSYCTLAHIYPKSAPNVAELATQLRLKPDFLSDPRCCLLLPKAVEVAMDCEAVVLAPSRDGVITVCRAHMERLSEALMTQVEPFIGHRLEWPSRSWDPQRLPFMRLLAWRCIGVLAKGELPPEGPWQNDATIAEVREAAMNASHSSEGTAGLGDLAGAFE